MVRAVFESLRVLLGILTFKKLSQYRVSSRNLVLGGGGDFMEGEDAVLN